MKTVNTLTVVFSVLFLALAGIFGLVILEHNIGTSPRETEVTVVSFVIVIAISAWIFWKPPVKVGWKYISWVFSVMALLSSSYLLQVFVHGLLTRGFLP